MNGVTKFVSPAGSEQTIEMPWGRLTWVLSSQQRNSGEMTFGRCLIDENCANGRHFHPNCEEILAVQAGTIVHSLGDEEITMHAGDTIRIPTGMIHNARNIGEGVADLLIVFSSGDRQTVDVDGTYSTQQSKK